MERITLFADVILPLPLPGFFTYRVPYELNNAIKQGVRVVVQFGKKKIYTALVYRIHENVPLDYQAKYILSVLDDFPVVNALQYSFWDWISKYYMCRPGEVMNTALPSSLKLESESCVALNPAFDKNFGELNEKEYLIAEALEIRQKLTLTEISNIIEQQKIIPLLKNMMEKNIILLEEELHEKFKPRTEVCVKLCDKYHDDIQLHKAFDELNRKAYKQLEVLMAFIQLTRDADHPAPHISRTLLLEKSKAATSQIHALIKKGIFETYTINQTRLKDFECTDPVDSIILTDEQERAMDEIKTHFSNKDVVLLHGITSSGKTEIYIKLISETLAQGRQTLFLLPEIALTTQIINRLRKYFGKEVCVYHSKYSNEERVEIWNRVLGDNNENGLNSKQYKVILGARSALFLPFSNLGLVIVDEEHDTSYKQADPPPRYNARDAAIVLARMHQAKTLLGSATPAVETYYNALSGKYGIAELNKRYGDMLLPEIIIANIKEQTRQKKMKSHFSETLFNLVNEALINKEQVILFQNRRGYSTRIECSDCNWVPGCKNCDVTLIYHKHINLLKCHYCGYTLAIPETCPACNSRNLHTKGMGTERIEEETELVFSGARIARMDLDSTRTKNAYLQILNDFEDRKTDILIGTQMITKGLDFDNVNIVGILNADNMLNFPDFRAHERSFQLMAQVSGRAGRRNKRGKVVIQTYNPEHPIIKLVLDHNYLEMCTQQLRQRQQFHYPPYSRLIQITLRHQDSNKLNEAASYLAQNLRRTFGKKVFGPEYPMVSRIRTYYLKNILIKLDRDNAIPAHKETILRLVDEFNKKFSSVKAAIDVDPN
ncbi:MAG TPA: primosomal protein N' [Bacteroidales bacterium]|nr:primosomal protein N' [Bacteroidales bacterium]